MREMLRMRSDPRRWIIKDVIPAGGKVIVFGGEGTFKTTVMFDMFIAIASGGSLFGSERFVIEKPGPVLIVSTEASIHENKERILQHCRAHNIADPEKLPVHYCQQPFLLDDIRDLSELEQRVHELRPVAVLLDPLDSFFNGEENSSKETKPMRRAIDRIVQATGTTFVIIHHIAKDPSRPGPRGTTAFSGWADGMLKFEVKLKKLGIPGEGEEGREAGRVKDPSGKTKIVTVEMDKQRHGPSKYVIFSGVVFKDSTPGFDMVRFAFYEGKDATEVQHLAFQGYIYRELLRRGEPLTNAALCEALGARPEQINEPLRVLEEEGYIDKEGRTPRPFGTDGARVRLVPGWRAVRKMTPVDLARRMIQFEADIEDEAETSMLLDPLLPGAPVHLLDQDLEAS